MKQYSGAGIAALALTVSAIFWAWGQTESWAADKKLAGQTIASDQDKNGRPDHWTTYSASGVKVLIASDTNGDGRPDSWKHPLQALLILREKDLNFDGKVDDRQVTDFLYDKNLKFNRHMFVWREADENFDGKIDLYRVRGQKKPFPDKVGQSMDAAPWSEAKEASEEMSRLIAASEDTRTVDRVRQMNARQDLARN